MYVKVRNGLARCRAVINAHVERNGVEFPGNLVLGADKQFHQGALLGLGDIKE